MMRVDVYCSRNLEDFHMLNNKLLSVAKFSLFLTPTKLFKSNLTSTALNLNQNY